MKALSYEELRALYKKFLHSQDISKATINTAYVDTFYLWRKGSKELFWSVATAIDFENEARNALIKALSENSTGNAKSLVSGYMSHLRRFRLFLSSDEIIVLAEYKQQITAKPKPASREIIINKMYVGGYLSEGDNIGHEIINLYKADDGKNYIYLNSQGTIESSHGESCITVLLVRKFASKTYKILAKADGITILDFADSKLPRIERYKGQVALGLTYGGVSLVDLFNENSLHAISKFLFFLLCSSNFFSINPFFSSFFIARAAVARSTLIRSINFSIIIPGFSQIRTRYRYWPLVRS